MTKIEEGRLSNIGLFGFGTVGQSLYEIISGENVRKFNFKNICVSNKSKKRKVTPDNLTYNPDKILSDSSIDIIVELTDNCKAAFEITKRALSNGTPVVSASKKMIALYMKELIELSNKYKTPLLYEASVCGSTPIISLLLNFYSGLQIDSIGGIVNTSSQYVLSLMEKDGVSYDDAILKAQECGYAESDPSLDMDGYDSLYKLAILLYHAYGLAVNPEALLRIGISDICPDDIQFARSMESRIKLLAYSAKHGNQVFAFVLPTLVGNKHRLYDINYDENGIEINNLSGFGSHFLTGKGAGGHPTATAVLSDLCSLRHKNNLVVPIPIDESIKLSNDYEMKFIVRIPSNKKLESAVLKNPMIIKSNEKHAYYSVSANMNELVSSSIYRSSDSFFLVDIRSDDFISENINA